MWHQVSEKIAAQLEGDRTAVSGVELGVYCLLAVTDDCLEAGGDALALDHVRDLVTPGKVHSVAISSEGRYGLGALGAPVAGHVGIRAMIEHHAVLYQDMQDPVAMLKGTDQPGAMSQYWPYTIEEQNAQRAATNAAQAEKFARYSNLMSASQPFVVDEIFASYSFDEHRCVLDVGGGQGTFLGRLAQHAKHLQLHLFDLPEVAALARAARHGRRIAPCRAG